MIELRWVQREPNIKDKHMMKDASGYLMVLQYRISDSCVDATGVYREAGDWIDVPTVTEG